MKLEQLPDKHAESGYADTRTIVVCATLLILGAALWPHIQREGRSVLCYNFGCEVEEDQSLADNGIVKPRENGNKYHDNEPYEPDYGEVNPIADKKLAAEITTVKDHGNYISFGFEVPVTLGPEFSLENAASGEIIIIKSSLGGEPEIGIIIHKEEDAADGENIERVENESTLPGFSYVHMYHTSWENSGERLKIDTNMISPNEVNPDNPAFMSKTVLPGLKPLIEEGTITKLQFTLFLDF